MAPRLVIPVDQGWTFKQADEDDTRWLAVAQFPTNVHLDLLAHKRIPDPNVGKNELDVQWVGERQWVYRTSFVTPTEGGKGTGTKTVLAMDGLDTFATVALNGTTILESDNMFIPHRIDVSAVVAEPGAANELVITFDSAYLRGWKLVEEHPDHKYGCWNGDISRLAVRKAQYHWGWDWGPTLLTCGPWRPIHLELYEARISDLSFATAVDESLQSATVEACAEIESTSPAVASTIAVRLDVSLDGTPVASETVPINTAVSRASVAFHINSPALWYPWRYGKQPLYTVRATLLQGEGDEVDVVTKRIGLRRAELVQEALVDQPGTSFYFKINNLPVFCGGSNWIPADNFIPRIDAKRYRDWVQRVVDGNQVMMRVWGGGIYEEQAFYDACDELGVLVWQDFLFGCGNYPVWPALRESIRHEADANVRLLRHHPSIVLWAGNNEDYQYQESEHLTYDYANKDAESWLKTDFPARYIYEKILAEVCAALVPDTYYHYGSPWGGGKDTHDPTVGDIHQWNVWHGMQEKYQNFDKLAGRFVSEFGMEAFPSTKTIDALLPQGRRDTERYAQSGTLDFHNKADGHERRLALYLAENIRYGPDPLEQYVYATQLIQAECLATAYRVWLRQWQGAAAGRAYCGGALVWQINDCWPCTSWSVCDYYGRPKQAYYAVRRALAPLTVGVARREHAHVPHDPPHTRVNVQRRTRLEVWATNLTRAAYTGVSCVVRAWNVETGRPTTAAARVVATGRTLAANQSTELAVLDLAVDGLGDPACTVVAAYLVADADADAAALAGGGAATKPLARSVNWPEPLKYLHLAQPTQLLAVLEASGDTVALCAEVPVKGVAVEVDDDDDDDNVDTVQFDDNLVDLVPGEVVQIGVRGAKASTKLRTRYLGMQGA